jgi:PPM family protein phosphatase
MLASVLAAHAAIRNEAAKDPELNGMGTTVTALVLDEVSHTYAIGHVGDSRAYLVRGGTLTQVTRDDTWVRDRVDAGELTAE